MVSRPKNLNNEERNLCVQFILQACSSGRPKRGRLLEVQVKSAISKSIVTRLSRATTEQQAQGLAMKLVSTKKGRTRDHNIKLGYDKIKSLSLTVIGSYRGMEAALDVNRATLHRWGKAGLFKVLPCTR